LVYVFPFLLARATVGINLLKYGLSQCESVALCSFSN